MAWKWVSLHMSSEEALTFQWELPCLSPYQNLSLLSSLLPPIWISFSSAITCLRTFGHLIDTAGAWIRQVPTYPPTSIVCKLSQTCPFPLPLCHPTSSTASTRWCFTNLEEKCLFFVWMWFVRARVTEEVQLYSKSNSSWTATIGRLPTSLFLSAWSSRPVRGYTNLKQGKGNAKVLGRCAKMVALDGWPLQDVSQVLHI